jgi:uncharacterized protein YcbX
MSMSAAVVTALYVYPVKGCAGLAVDRAVVVERGFDRDRRWMIVDADGMFVTQRSRPELALVRTALDGGEIVLDAPGLSTLRLPARHDSGARRDVQVWSHIGAAAVHPEGSAWVSRYLVAPHALVYMPDDHRRPVNPERARPGDVVSFADGYPILLVSEASLADLNGRLAAPMAMTRFRPNIVVAGCAPFAEDGWARLRIGEIGFRGVKPCDRCVVTTIDPTTGKGGVEPLRTLASFRRVYGDSKVYFGMNLIHDGGGALTVGDAVTVA